MLARKFWRVVRSPRLSWATWCVVWRMGFRRDRPPTYRELAPLARVVYGQAYGPEDVAELRSLWVGHLERIKEEYQP